MNLINIRWGFYEGMGCGIVDGNYEQEVTFGDDKDILFVSLSNCADCYKVSVTSYSVFDMNKYLCINQSDALFNTVTDMIDKVTLEAHDLLVECNNEDEAFNNINSKYKEYILKAYEISKEFKCDEDNEFTVNRILEKYIGK